MSSEFRASITILFTERLDRVKKMWPDVIYKSFIFLNTKIIKDTIRDVTAILLTGSGVLVVLVVVVKISLFWY